MKKHFAACVCALFGLFAYTVSDAAEPGQPAPHCELAALGNSPASDTGHYQGKVVLVDFWASWCPPCLKSLPYLNTLDHDLHKSGLQVIGVNVDEHVELASAFLERHPAHFSVGSDSKGICPKAFGIMGMPTSYLVDRNGVVRFVHIGFRDSDRETLRHTIETLLDEKQTPPVVAATTESEMHHHHE